MSQPNYRNVPSRGGAADAAKRRTLLVISRSPAVLRVPKGCGTLNTEAELAVLIRLSRFKSFFRVILGKSLHLFGQDPQGT